MRLGMRSLVLPVPLPTDFDWSSDDEYMASASLDKSLRVWEVSSGKCLRIIYTELQQLCIRFHPVRAWPPSPSLELALHLHFWAKPGCCISTRAYNCRGKGCLKWINSHLSPCECASFDKVSDSPGKVRGQGCPQGWSAAHVLAVHLCASVLVAVAVLHRGTAISWLLPTPSQS